MAQENPANLEALKHKIRHEEAVVIVGAGVSIAASGAASASWKGLLEEGLKCARKYYEHEVGFAEWEKHARLLLDNPSIENWIDCAKRITTKLRGPEHECYRHWLKETVGSLELRNRKPIDAIIDLGLPIATTNFDLLIEKAIDPASYDLLAFTWRDPKLVGPFLENRLDRNMVYHIHGTYLDLSTIVFDTTNYEKYITNTLPQLWQHYLSSTRSIIFIGFNGGLRDPNFLPWLRWIDTHEKALNSNHFVLLQEFEKEQIWSNGETEQRLSRFEDWLRPVTYPCKARNDFTQFVPFLEALARDCGRKRRTAISSPATPSDLRNELLSHFGRRGVPVYSIEVERSGRMAGLRITIVPLHRRNIPDTLECLDRFEGITIGRSIRQDGEEQAEADIVAANGTAVPCRIVIRPLLQDFAKRLTGLARTEPHPVQGAGHPCRILEAAIETASRAAEPFLDREARTPVIMSEGVPNHDSRDMVVSLLEQCDAPPEMIERFGKAIHRQIEALKPVGEHERRQDFLERIGRLGPVADDLLRILDDLQALGIESGHPAKKRQLDFHIGMERALCLAELGCHTGDEDMLRKAIVAYRAIDGDLAAAGTPEPLTKYRLGRAYASNEDPASALECYEAGYSLLSEEKWSLAKPDWLRVTLPRSLGYMHWSMADDLRTRARRNGDEKNFKLAERRDHMARAVRCTLSAYAQAKLLRGIPGSSAEIEAELETLMNNLLSISLDYVELHGGDWASLAALGGKSADTPLDRDALDDIARQLAERIGGAVANRHHRLDTLRVHAWMTGDTAMTRHFAKAVLASFEDQIGRGFELKDSDCRMTEDALRSLRPEAGDVKPTHALRTACPRVDDLLMEWESGRHGRGGEEAATDSAPGRGDA